MKNARPSAPSSATKLKGNARDTRRPPAAARPSAKPSSNIAILKRCQPPPDSLADRVDLFPMPGVTPGLCGLLLSGPRHTTIICGDIPTTGTSTKGQDIPMAPDIYPCSTSFEEAGSP